MQPKYKQSLSVTFGILPLEQLEINWCESNYSVFIIHILCVLWKVLRNILKKKYVRILRRSSLLMLTYSCISVRCFHSAEVSSPSLSTSLIFFSSCNETRSCDSVFFSMISTRLDWKRSSKFMQSLKETFSQNKYLKNHWISEPTCQTFKS